MENLRHYMNDLTTERYSKNCVEYSIHKHSNLHDWNSKPYVVSWTSGRIAFKGLSAAVHYFDNTDCACRLLHKNKQLARKIW